MGRAGPTWAQHTSPTCTATVPQAERGHTGEHQEYQHYVIFLNFRWKREATRQQKNKGMCPRPYSKSVAKPELGRTTLCQPWNPCTSTFFKQDNLYIIINIWEFSSRFPTSPHRRLRSSETNPCVSPKISVPTFRWGRDTLSTIYHTQLRKSTLGM